MLESYITFRSLTQAQQGKRALQAYEINAQLTRAPKTLAERGCTHALLLRGIDLPMAANALRVYGVPFRKIVRFDGSGNLVEVRV
ncbi:MAG: DUF3343 domain-containing protein [Ruminococcaceae bacterium]|nr:DUF3343 domain-containing protein [Oscillospiraceae bacterium]